MALGDTLLQGLIGQGIAAGFNFLSGLVDIVPQGKIDSIPIMATLEESHTDTMTVTEHPVERGAEVSDHSYIRMPEVTLNCGWSNSVPTDLLSAILGQNNIVNQIASAVSVFSGGQPTVGGYVAAVYSQLIALQQSQKRFLLVTSLRSYPNMLMTSVRATRDPKTSQALMVSATFRQIRVVNTSSATLPPITQRNNVPDANEVSEVGTQLLKSNTVGPGPTSGNAFGSISPPSTWSAPSWQAASVQTPTNDMYLKNPLVFP
jgi:hypothetical protein